MFDSPLSASAYEVLEVDPAIDEEALRKAYRLRMRQTHPDTGGDAAVFIQVQRAWELVGELNRCFDAPLVDASKGGSGGGGASLTPLGRKLLKSYRAMQAAAQTAVGREMNQLRRRVGQPAAG